MGEDVLSGFLFWQERSHMQRNWQKDASVVEMSGNGHPTAAGRRALATGSQLLVLHSVGKDVPGGWCFSNPDLRVAADSVLRNKMLLIRIPQEARAEELNALEESLKI